MMEREIVWIRRLLTKQLVAASINSQRLPVLPDRSCNEIQLVLQLAHFFQLISEPQCGLLAEPIHRKQRYLIPVRKHHFVLAQIFFRTIYYTKKVWRACYFTWSFLSCWGWMKANVNQHSELRLCTANSQSLPLIITQVNWISLLHRLPDDSLSTEVQKWSSRCNNICT